MEIFVGSRNISIHQGKYTIRPGLLHEGKNICCAGDQIIRCRKGGFYKDKPYPFDSRGRTLVEAYLRVAWQL
jgi:hypothetical protein